MRIRLCVLSIALFAASVAEATNAREAWRCAVMGQRQTVLYLVEDESKSYVKFSGQRIACNHSVEGTTHRWDWGNNAVALTDDLVAKYYEGGSAEAKGLFKCKKSAQ